MVKFWGFRPTGVTVFGEIQISTTTFIACLTRFRLISHLFKISIESLQAHGDSSQSPYSSHAIPMRILMGSPYPRQPCFKSSLVADHVVKIHRWRRESQDGMAYRPTSHWLLTNGIITPMLLLQRRPYINLFSPEFHNEDNASLATAIVDHFLFFSPLGTLALNPERHSDRKSKSKNDLKISQLGIESPNCSVAILGTIS